jgi:hypothetical protein
LGEPLPDHSRLTRIRDRSGVAVFRRFFEAIVAQCQAAGLVWGPALYLDATKVAANASIASGRPRFAVEAHLDHLFRTGDEAGDGDGGTDGPQAPPPSWPVVLTEEAQAALATAAERRHDWLGQAGRPDRDVLRGGYRRTADCRASATDPDASLMRHRDGGLDLGYQDHDVVDGDRCPRGQALPFRRRRIAERIRIDQAPAAAGKACPLKQTCPGSERGRQIRRREDEASLDWGRGYHATEPYRKAMRKRQVWVEPLFAEAKAWHGLRRFRLRGLPKVTGEALLIAAGQNLKRLLSRRGWGRRPWPSGARGWCCRPYPESPWPSRDPLPAPPAVTHPLRAPATCGPFFNKCPCP